MKHLRYLLMAALVAMPMTACDDDEDGDGTVEPPAVGTVSGTVSVEGNGLAGVSVTLVGQASQSATTASGGGFTFNNVEAGSYGVTISEVPSDVSFSTTSKTTSITTDGQTVTVDFSGSYIRTSTIAGQVVVDGDGIAGVAVTATGPEGTDNAVTDNGGNYSFSGLRAGDYTVAITPGDDYTFATTSYAITLGTGEAKTASFFGEMVVTTDPVTANLLIQSVKDDDGDFVDPSEVSNDIYVTLDIDPGENQLSEVCVLLDGEVVPNGCQTLSAGVEDMMLQSGNLAPTFAILTDDFDEDTGTPDWFNGDHTLSARLSLVGAEQANVTTTMTLTFDNDERVVADLVSEYQTVVGGDYMLGGDQTVTLLPVLYSGKELADIEVCFDWDCFTVEGPFPVTETFAYDFDTFGDAAIYLDETVSVGNGTYADGTAFSPSINARLEDVSTGIYSWDYQAPTWPGDLNLTDQLAVGASGEAELACCSNNWVGPDYAPADGLAADPTDGSGVGIALVEFTVEDLATEEVFTLAEDGTMADAGLPLSLVNTEYELCAEATDDYGNSSSTCLVALGSNPLATIGYDDTAPTNQTVTAQPPAQVVYNIADGLAAVDLGGLTVSATEDRSGLSGLPFRSYMRWWNASDTEYIVAQDVDDGGMVNLAQSILSCDASGDVTPGAGATICYPDYTSADGVYYVTGSMNNQAGVANATMVEGWVFNDQTAPVITSNVQVPFNINVGEPMTFSGPVSDNLHLGTTAFGFNLAPFTDLFLPLGENIVNSANDLNPWDGNFPTSETASITIDPAIVGVELYGAAPPAVNKFNAVRAIHTDAAGNPSNQEANNIVASSVEDPALFTGIDAWSVDAPVENLCNGQGAADCDIVGGDLESVEFDIIAEGPAGTFANPFLPGDVYIYLRVDDGDATITDGEDIYLIDVLDASSAVITDEGAGGSRFYTWSYTLTKDQVAAFPAGTVYYLHAMGVKHSTGTGLLDPVGSNNITIVDGS